MSVTRRNFVKATGSLAAAVAATSALPRSSMALDGLVLRGPVVRDLADYTRSQLLVADPVVRALALRAVDAARRAGADYADVRLTRTVKESSTELSGHRFSDDEDFAIGVRAFVKGYWGFAASPFWELDEADLLAQSAVEQARFNARGTVRTAELGNILPVSGSWTMPVTVDPFTISMEEKLDVIYGWKTSAGFYHPGMSRPTCDMYFQRQERAVATSDGSYYTQTAYQTTGSFTVTIGEGFASASGLGAAGKGWELLTDANVPDQIPALVAEAVELSKAPVKVVEPGRYETVFNGPTVAELLDKTIGVATELDRVLGYESNASGTSYLGPEPLDVLGTFAVGTSALRVTADRSTPGALATVAWDDEGSVPQNATLIDAGIVSDFQTTREQAGWLAPWYQKHNRPVRSSGCAGAESAMGITMQRPPNLAMSPGKESTTFEQLIGGVKRGYAFYDSSIETDQQAKNGASILGSRQLVREIVNGKVGAVIKNAGILFNTIELWKNVTVLAGPSSAEWYGCLREKGQPKQTTAHSVRAVPMLVKNVAAIDITRKA